MSNTSTAHIVVAGHFGKDVFAHASPNRKQRYIEMNPVRAGIVAHPGEYRWSSYACNGQGETSDLLSPHPVYLSSGRTAEERQASYRELFRHELEPGFVDQIRRATNGNFSLGNQKFTEEIAAMLGRRVIPGKAGRPGKQTGGVPGTGYETQEA